MRIVLFYSGVESFNYFTDMINIELREREHDTFILDLRNPSGDNPHSYNAFNKFASQKIDMVICYDGLGIKEEVFNEFWDANDAVAVNILMDHPLRFHSTMMRHPKRYIQFCCDKNHVDYVRKYFSNYVKNVEFMPHAGTLINQGTHIKSLDAVETTEKIWCDDEIDVFEKRPYDILFTGTYYPPDVQFAQLEQYYEKGSSVYNFYENVNECLKADSSLTAELAVLKVIDDTNMNMSQEMLLELFKYAEFSDWMIRMYQRERVVTELVDGGADVWLLGRGWCNHPYSNRHNFHWIKDRVPFAETFDYIKNAKINLNVMPWFKDGTHDRIFNILLQKSVPLTDTSKWLKEHFKDKTDIAFYSLDRISELPFIVEGLLSDSEKCRNIISNGYKNVSKNYTWKNCVDEILEFAEI